MLVTVVNVLVDVAQRKDNSFTKEDLSEALAEKNMVVKDIDKTVEVFKDVLKEKDGVYSVDLSSIENGG